MEGSLQATAEVFNAAEAQTAAVVAGIGQSGLVGGVAVADGNSGINDTKDRDR
jgi:hypothetical protein